MGLLDFIFGYSSEAPSIFPHDPNDERAWNSSGYRDYWGGHSGPSSSGLYVRPDDAIGVSCIFLGVMIYANLLGTNPIKFYRNRPNDEGEDPLYSHPLLDILSPDGRPNPWQTGASWRMVTEAHRTLWGLAISEIRFSSQGLELWPVEPDHISQIDQMDDGRMRYVVSEPGKSPRTLMQDQLFRAEGFGTHRLIPENLLRRSREAVGVWIAQEKFRGLYFERGAAPSVVIEREDEMSDKALQRFKQEVQGRIGGLRNAHRLVVLEKMKLREFGHTARNAQLVEAWDAQAKECSRYLGLPAYMLGADEQPPYASREPAARELYNIQLKPRARMIEAAIKRDLITQRDVVCEIDLSSFLEGDALAMAQRDAIYIMNGVLSENEVRRRQGYNPVEGLDTPRRSVNQDRGGDPRQPREKNPGDRETSGKGLMAEALAPVLPFVPESLGWLAREPVSLCAATAQHPGGEDDRDRWSQVATQGDSGRSVSLSAGDRDGEGGTVSADPAPQTSEPGSYHVVFEHEATAFRHSRQVPGLPVIQAPPGSTGPFVSLSHHHLRLTLASASRLFRRETEALKKAAIRHASNPKAWSLWLQDFYRSHAHVLAEGLAIELARAEAYTEAHRRQAEERGIQALAEWERVDDGRATVAAENISGGKRMCEGVREMVELATGEHTR